MACLSRDRESSAESHGQVVWPTGCHALLLAIRRAQRPAGAAPLHALYDLTRDLGWACNIPNETVQTNKVRSEARCASSQEPCRHAYCADGDPL